jgi:hypothetical protein
MSGAITHIAGIPVIGRKVGEILADARAQCKACDDRCMSTDTPRACDVDGPCRTYQLIDAMETIIKGSGKEFTCSEPAEVGK